MSEYLSGYGSTFESEALAGALPRGQNTPRRAPYGLYPEQVNGTPFTVRRDDNRRVWLYKIRPSVIHSELEPLESRGHLTGDFAGGHVDPNVMRWRPLAIPSEPTDFLDGLHTFGGHGDPLAKRGIAIHLYAANADMSDRCFYDADGELLVVPQSGALDCVTELGPLHVEPGEILLIPRGLKVSIALPDGAARGYVCELFGERFRLPERGPIGANGLADARHFLAPVARYEDRACNYEIVAKLGGKLYRATQDHSPFDVVAWHGNYAPFKYDLAMFNAMGTVTWDHPDPSILTVLTCPYDDHGNGLCDFAVFRGRWEVSEHTFRPPFFHRNAATEFNGVVRMSAPAGGFEPGCYFVTPMLSAHGVNTAAVEAQFAKTDDEADAPSRIPDESLWIMFESCLPIRLTDWAMSSNNRDAEYREAFRHAPSHFSADDPTGHFDR